jgi:hypothetical protein
VVSADDDRVPSRVCVTSVFPTEEDLPCVRYPNYVRLPHLHCYRWISKANRAQPLNPRFSVRAALPRVWSSEVSIVTLTESSSPIRFVVVNRSTSIVRISAIVLVKRCPILFPALMLVQAPAHLPSFDGPTEAAVAPGFRPEEVDVAVAEAAAAD